MGGKAGRKRGRGKGGAAASGSAVKRKRRLLNKEEKAQVMLSICNVDIRDLLSYVKDTVSGEKHLVESVARQEFWKCLQISETLVSELLRTLASLFGLLYKNCDKGFNANLNLWLQTVCWKRMVLLMY